MLSSINFRNYKRAVKMSICHEVKKKKNMWWVTAIMSAVSFANGFMNKFLLKYGGQAGGRGYYTQDGFYDYTANVYIHEQAVAVEYLDKYLGKVIDSCVRDGSAAVASKAQEMIDYLKTVKRFSSYKFGSCVNSVNSVVYNKNKGELYLKLIYLEPYLIKARGTTFKAARASHLYFSIHFEMAKDFVILAKVKANWFRGVYSEELRFIDEKAITKETVTQAMAMALAPCILGIVKMPAAFITQVEIIAQNADEETRQAVAEATGNPVYAKEFFLDWINSMKQKQGNPNVIYPKFVYDPTVTDYSDEELQGGQSKETVKPLESNSHPYWRRYPK